LHALRHLLVIKASARAKEKRQQEKLQQQQQASKQNKHTSHPTEQQQQAAQQRDTQRKIYKNKEFKLFKIDNFLKGFRIESFQKKGNLGIKQGK